MKASLALLFLCLTTSANAAGVWWGYLLNASNVWTGSNNITGQFTPSGGVTSTNSPTSTALLWTSTKNTDGNLYLILSKPPFYQLAYNPLTNFSMADSIVVGNMIAAGDDTTGTGVPIRKFGDCIVIGLHCANWVTNANSSVFIGYGAGQGQQSVVGIAPYIYDHSIFIGGDVGSFYQSSNMVNCFFMGAGSGSVWGNQGGQTNNICIGQFSGVVNGSLNNTNDTIIGNNCELPSGASGEASFGNLIYWVSNNVHGAGNVGIGNYTGVGNITNKLQIEGVSQATYGFFSKSRNALAPISITVTASPFTFKNDGSAGNAGGTNNINVFVDAGTVSAISINGTTIFTSTGKVIPLQLGESMVVTYSSIPTMTYKPF